MSREEQIATVVDRAVERIESGSFVDFDSLQNEHPDLMPELGDQLRTWRDILRAQELAQSAPAEGSGEPCSTQDDIELLCRHLEGYEVLEPIHRGGQGAVYRALQLSTRRTVALKVLVDGPLASPRHRRRFEREVDLTARLRHPNIVTLYDSGVVGGRYYFAMEYVNGESIADHALLHDLSARRRVELFEKVVRAVSAAHQLGIIHRDLKPSNILADAQGEPHVLDFGLAKALDETVADEPAELVSMLGHVVGTLPYLSPEQASGLHRVDTRSDVYSLGVVLFELLTGEFPYVVTGERVDVRKHILSTAPRMLRQAPMDDGRDGFPSPREIDGDLEAIVAKSLEKEPDDRYQSAAALAEELRRWLDGDAVLARADRGLYVLRKTVRRYRVHAAVAALFVALLGISSVAVTLMWLNARHERDNARDATRLAHATLDQVVTEIDESIRPLAGGVAVRDRLLDGVSDKLARLEPLVASDAALEGVLAALHEKQGDIAYAEGRHAEAEEHYQVFVQMKAPVDGPESASDEQLAALARGYRKLGMLAGAPAGLLRQSIEHGRRLVERRPEANEPTYDLCVSLVEAAKRGFLAGHYRQAREHIDSALGAARRYAGAEGPDDRWGRLLARALAREGVILHQIGDGERSVHSLREALSIRKNLCERSPSDVDLRYQLMKSYQKLGNVYRSGGDVEEAISTNETAVEIGEYLVRMDPTVTVWKRDLVAAHNHLVDLLLSRDLERAQLHSDVSVSIAEALLESEPHDTGWQRFAAYSYVARGRVRLAQDDLEAAYTDFELATELKQRLAANAPRNVSFQTELATGYDYLGWCSRLMDQQKRAFEQYSAACEIRKALFEAHPDTLEHALDVILSQSKLATWHITQRTEAHDAKAAEFLRVAEAELNRLKESGRMVGREGTYAYWMDVVRRNFDLIDRRAKRREEARAEERANAAASSSPEQQ